MIFQFKDGREFDSENEEDVERLARALIASESAIAELQRQVKALDEAFKQAMARPVVITPPDMKAVVDAVNDMNRNVRVGLERVVIAQLADTVLVRDGEGEPERAKKEVI